jgi:heptose I phosphotransferase
MSNAAARIGTPTILGRVLRGNVILRAQPDFEIAAGERWQHRVMRETVTDKLHEKQGRAIARWHLPGLTLFLKRHYKLPLRHAVGAMLFPRHAWSPGLQEWHNLQWVERQGLPVPRAVAAAEWRGPGLSLQSFLAVEELAGMLPLHEAIPLAKSELSPLVFAKWKRGLVKELARLSAELHRRDRFHMDLYLCHFYLRENDCRTDGVAFRNRVFMIDFHRLRRHRLAGRWFRIKDIAQLLYSTHNVDGVTDRDALRFWKHYCAALAAPKGLFTAVRWKCALYLRHSRRKSVKARRKAGV